MTPDEIDNIPYVNERGQIVNHKENERDEQNLVRKYLRKDAKVLELGARYGTVSCLVSAILDVPENHVAVEPDVFVLPALIHNKLTHYGKFHIVVGAISKSPVAFDYTCGYGNHTVPSTFSTIETFTLEEIEKRYDIKFNCLIADCEGFLEQFFRENPSFVSGLDMIIFEADGDKWCNYEYIKNVLRQNGLHPVVDGFQSVWIKE